MPVELVREALQRVLGSPGFDASARNRRFLEHIVEETLAGRADRLKGLSVAVDVFGRDATTFDSEHDPVVRIEAAKLRRSLERYYLTAGGDDPVRIDIPKGTYVPTFERRAEPAAEPPPHLPAEVAAPAAAGSGQPTQPRSARLAVTLSGIALLAAAAASFWLARPAADPSGVQAATSPQLAGPAVIVAPFDDLTGTEPGRLFAGGLTQELITSLMRFADLRIYAVRGDEPVDEDAGQRLDVRYRIQGSVGRAPDRLHLNVHLLELDSGRYVWSETYDRPLTAATIFDLQEEIAGELAGRLGEPYGVIHKVTADLFRRHRPDTLSAYDCTLQAFAYRRTYSRELYLATRRCLEQTVRDDPDYAVAWALLAYAALDEYRWYGWGPLHGMPAALDQALAAARRGLDLAPDDVTTLMAYAAVQFYRGELAEAEAAGRRAVELNPNNPEARAQLGWRLAYAGDWPEGIALVRQAINQSMAERGWYYLWLAIDDYRRGAYRAALANLQRVGGPFFFVRPAIEAMCEARLGHRGRARQALDAALALDPTFAEDPRGAFRLHRTPEDLIDGFMDGLRAAGLKTASGKAPSGSAQLDGLVAAPQR